MTGSRVLGWAMGIGGAWWLLSGLLFGDMGGIAGPGCNPDLPPGFGRAPGGFILGIAINAAVIFYGLKLIRVEPG